MKLVKIARAVIIGASISLFSVAAAYAEGNIKLEATVIGDIVNIRTEPSTDSTIIGKTTIDSSVVVTGKVGEWYSLDYNGEVAYIYGQYIKCNSAELLPEMEVQVTEKVVVVTEASSVGQQIVDYAKQFVGTPYVYGGTNLTNGVDCSGFTTSVMKKFGINLSRRSSDQLQNGTKVSKNELMAGDLVFFNTSGSGISHVGIYIGDGAFIHSSTARSGGVKIDSLNDKYYISTYVSGCRVAQ